ncbi:efflux RND transporter permease subunit [bacterium]|nr:efflux RND transporter permease subunit [candidate division CSSED10-310 bacterium]
MVTERSYIHPLPRWAHRRPVTALMCCISMVVVGGYALQALPLEFSPETTSTWMWINVPYSNSTPQEVDRLIGEPLEGQLKLMRSVKQIRLTSSTVGCSANLQFEKEADMDNAYLEARDAIERVRGDFPVDVGTIRIYRQRSDDIPLLWMGLSLPDHQIDDLYWLVQDRIKPAIERIDGVASVDIHGLEGESLHIDLDFDKVSAHAVNVYELSRSLSAANENASIGRMDDGGKGTLVRTRYKLESEDDYRELPLTDGSIRLQDVARVDRRLPEEKSIHRVNGEPGFTLSINKESSANAVQVGRNVMRVLDRLKTEPELKKMEILPFFDQSRMIVSSLEGLLHTGLWGALFALLILYLFIRHLATTCIIILSVPLSILTALAGLYFAGYTLNLGTMMGLMLAIGMLVDNSVVSAENIYRYRKISTDFREASIVGASQVGTAINASTMTTIIVFLPLIFASGEIGVWMKQIGFPIALSLIASLFISLSLVPLAITHCVRKPLEYRSRLIPRLTQLYLYLLRWILNHRLMTVLIIILLLASIAVAYKGIAVNMNGDMAMRQIIIRVIPPDNYDLNQREEVLIAMERPLLDHRSEIDLKDMYSVVDLENGFLRLFLKDTGKDFIKDDAIRARIRELLPELPGVKWWFGWQVGDSGGNLVDISFEGRSPDTLRELAENAVHYLLADPDIVDVIVEDSTAMPEIHLTINRELAVKNNVSPYQIAQTVSIALMGRTVSRFYADTKEIDVRIQLQPEDRENLAQLLNLPVFAPDGRSFPMTALIRYEIAPGPGSIQRVDGKVLHDVQIEMAERDTGKARAIIERALKPMAMPPGYSWRLGRTFFDFDIGLKESGQAFILASILVLLLLGALFESLLHPLTILLSLPFALVGTFWGLRITHTELNITGNIGLIILIGIVVNNAIVLVDHINQLRARGQNRRDAIIQAGEDRFRPIVMTAGTTILGLAPMAMASGDFSARMYSSLAITVMGGLITSTALTLLVLPLFYVLMDNFQQTMIRWFRSFTAIR